MTCHAGFVPTVDPLCILLHHMPRLHACEKQSVLRATTCQHRKAFKALLASYSFGINEVHLIWLSQSWVTQICAYSQEIENLESRSEERICRTCKHSAPNSANTWREWHYTYLVRDITFFLGTWDVQDSEKRAELPQCVSCYARIHVYAHSFVHTYVWCIHSMMHTYIYTYVYTYIYTCTHACCKVSWPGSHPKKRGEGTERGHNYGTVGMHLIHRYRHIYVNSVVVCILWWIFWHACMYVCMHACTIVYLNVCLCVCLSIYIYIYIYIYILGLFLLMIHSCYNQRWLRQGGGRGPPLSDSSVTNFSGNFECTDLFLGFMIPIHFVRTHGNPRLSTLGMSLLRNAVFHIPLASVWIWCVSLLSRAHGLLPWSLSLDHALILAWMDHW